MNNGSRMGCLDWILALLQVVFIVLKVCNVIAWNWWLVFIPVYIFAGLFIIVLILNIIANR